MDAATLMYCKAITLSNPRAVLINRWSPPEQLAGGLIIPQIVRDKEARSGFWGLLLKVSNAPTEDESLIILRDYLREELGSYILFNAQNPVLGGLPQCPSIQLLAAGEVLACLKPKQFYETILAGYTRDDTQMVQDLFNKFTAETKDFLAEMKAIDAAEVLRSSHVPS